MGYYFVNSIIIPDLYDILDTMKKNMTLTPVRNFISGYLFAAAIIVWSFISTYHTYGVWGIIVSLIMIPLTILFFVYVMFPIVEWYIKKDQK